MNSDQATDNRRILVIDDNANIHEDFRKILMPLADSDSLTRARAALFGEVPTLPSQIRYELDFASQGREGFGLAQNAYQRGNPYAVAFVDMRMPPGWDGLETIEHLWYADPDIQIVICSAYSDHPWEDVSRRIGDTDKLLQANIVSRAADILLAPSRNGLEAAFRQKEEFLAIMSHEILTPMNELVRKVQLLLDSPLSPGQREHATTLQRCAQDLLSLINDMHVFMAGGRQETQT